MKYLLIDRETWLEKFAKSAHESVFEEHYPEYDSSMFDFALVVIDEVTDTPIIYNVIRILKTTTAYIEYGGSFPPFRGSPKVKKAFSFLLEKMKNSGYKTVILMTMTTNVPMQKLALACGFLVHGITSGRHGLCLEYRLNFKEEKQNESIRTDGDLGGDEHGTGGSASSSEKKADACRVRANSLRPVDG